ncbi:MAG: hypothetical protein V4665_00235 [Patescibacteria group bacterium]
MQNQHASTSRKPIANTVVKTLKPVNVGVLIIKKNEKVFIRYGESKKFGYIIKLPSVKDKTGELTKEGLLKKTAGEYLGKGFTFQNPKSDPIIMEMDGMTFYGYMLEIKNMPKVACSCFISIAELMEKNKSITIHGQAYSVLLSVRKMLAQILSANN